MSYKEGKKLSGTHPRKLRRKKEVTSQEGKKTTKTKGKKSAVARLRSYTKRTSDGLTAGG